MMVECQKFLNVAGVVKHLNQNKMKQTAVEWLGKELESYGDPQFCKIEWEQLDLLIKQAKEMEKQQIIDSFEIVKKPLVN
jgi:hypothetical protein